MIYEQLATNDFSQLDGAGPTLLGQIGAGDHDVVAIAVVHRDALVVYVLEDQLLSLLQKPSGSGESTYV